MPLGIKPPASHHRFRLVDVEHGVALPDAVGVHTVELTKYNLGEESLSGATAIERWAFFLCLPTNMNQGVCGSCCQSRSFSKPYPQSK